MASQTARIDAIEAAIASLAASQQTIVETLARLASTTVTPQTVSAPASPTASRAARRAIRTTRQAAQSARATAGPSYPKAAEGVVSGTVVKTARQGYGVLIATASGEQWLNAPRAGAPIFAALTIGQPVAYESRGNGLLARVEPVAPVAPKTASVAALAASGPRARTVAPTTPETAPVAQTRTLGAIGSCEACGGRHTHDSGPKRTLECLSRQYTRLTGNEPAGILDATFTAWAQARVAMQGAATAAPVAPRTPSAPVAPTVAPAVTVDTSTVARCGQPTKSGSPCKSRVDGARICLQHPPVTIAAPDALSDTAPVETEAPKEGKPADGVYTVVLRQFPEPRQNKVKVHDLNGFQGNDGTGRWMTKLDPTLYTKLTKMTVGDRLQITTKNGIMVKAKRVAKIESDTGIVAGVKGSGTNLPAKQVTGKRADDTKTEARTASHKAKAKAKANGSHMAPCSGTAQHKNTCAYWTTQTCSAAR